MLSFLAINMMHINLVMHHPMYAQVILLLLACLVPFVCSLFRGLDDDVEADDSYVYPTQDFDQYRSEERRVGKECRL